MKNLNLPDASQWAAPSSELGSCFHQALTRWGHLHARGASHGWRIAVGIVRDGIQGTDNVHAWLEHDRSVISAVSGELHERDTFYRQVGIDKRTVRRVNPRSILRQAKAIDRHAVKALLDEWGGRYRVLDTGGIVAE